jgi:hypothetical protein
MNQPHRLAEPVGLSAGLAILVQTALAMSALFVAGCGDTAPPRPAESPRVSSPAASPETETKSAAAQAEPARTESSDDFKILEGKWLRDDGGYVLEIRRVERDGKLEAAYFNPSPIRVAKAETKRQSGLIQVFVELRDQGYPGCTYNLVYDAGHKCLAGNYFQAAMGQTFPVVFTRSR